MMHLLVTFVIPAQIGATVPADSVALLQREARRAEATWERLARQRAPGTWALYAGSECDEVVGRFCLRFDSTTTRPEATEDPAVTDARAAAIEAARAFFLVSPGELSAAGPVVRLLIADARPSEAVAAARTFAAASGDPLWRELLTGFALHAAGADSAAELHFARALARLTPVERRRWLDPDWLIEPAAVTALRRLPDDDRAELERKLWLRADPFWTTAANERWVEHIARWVQARLLADVPRVVDMARWGADLDELTVRYGVPVARSRSRGPPGTTRSGTVEYWDSAQRAYTPARPDTAVPQQPPPGEHPALYSARARTAYAYTGVSRVLELEHQTTRFPAGDDVVLRFDGVVRPPDDSMHVAQRPVPVAAIVRDTAFRRRWRSDGHADWDGDRARFTLFVRVPAEPVIYSVEALDTARDIAARARYAVPGPDTPVAAPGSDAPELSDILIARAFAPGPMPLRHDDPRIRARASLVVERGDTLGVYAEVRGATAAAGDRPGLGIEVRLESMDEPSLLGAAVRRIGRAIGLVAPDQDPAVAWQEPGSDIHVVALNLPLDPTLRGRYDLVLRVTIGDGEPVETRRSILISGAPARE